MTAGSASGIAATARLTAVRNISRTGSPRNNPTRNIKAQIASTISANRLPKRVRRFCNGVFTERCCCNREAIFPNSVVMPTANVTPMARPRVTCVPLYAKFFRSPRVASASDRGVVVFETASDSPVSAASSISRFSASISRKSAGTTLPASR